MSEDEIIVGEIEITCSVFFLSVLHFHDGEWKNKDNQTNKKNILSNTNIRFVRVIIRLLFFFCRKLPQNTGLKLHLLFQMARF